MNTGPKWRTVGAVWLFVLVAWLAVLAQELGDAEYRNLTVTTAMTANDGTDRDWYMSFDHGGTTATLGWDDSDSAISVDNANFSVETSGAVGVLFRDGTSGFSGNTGSFTVNDTGNDGRFVVSALLDDTSNNSLFGLTWSSNGNPLVQWIKGSNIVQATYTGTLGSQYWSIDGAQGYRFDDDVYVDENSGATILKDSGGTCYRCTLATTQTYSNTNVTTDRSYDADSTSIDEIADVLGTLIADLDTINHVGTSTDNVLVCTSTTCPTVNP